MNKKVLIIVTSHNILGKTGYPTGFWLPELTHPYNELINNGFQIDIASIKGGKAPIDPYSDPLNSHSINEDDEISKKYLASTEFIQKIENTKLLSEIKSDEYIAALFAGGNGAIFDFPDNPEVQKIILEFWNEGKIVSTICHGGAALLNVRLSSGEFLVKDKVVTAFNNEEEKIAQSTIGAEYLPFYLEDELKKRGAIFKQAAPFTPYVEVSENGQLITGQQNFSGELIGKKLVEALS